MTETTADPVTATCYCSEEIVRRDGRWVHAFDGKARCWPDDPQHAGLMAEPDPYLLRGPDAF